MMGMKPSSIPQASHGLRNVIMPCIVALVLERCYRIQDSGFRIRDSEFRIQNSTCGFQNLL